MVFQNIRELRKAFPDLKRSKRLHPLTEHRLAELLRDIYPEAYPKHEPGEIPGGRSDLAFYFGNGCYVIFEIFATKHQVPQDLRHLEQSNAQGRIAILTDPILDEGAIFEEYFTKKPRDPFPWLKLSDILVVENERATKEQLKQYIDAALGIDKNAQLPSPYPELKLKLYKMGRDQARHDEIFFETDRSLPQQHQFGFVLENMTESTMAKGIHIRVAFSWRGHDLYKAPWLQAPRYPGWTTQVSELVCEQPAILTFKELDLPCFHGQPIEWDNVRLNLLEHMRGDLLIHYRISSVQPYTDSSGELKVVLGDG